MTHSVRSRSEPNGRNIYVLDKPRLSRSFTCQQKGISLIFTIIRSTWESFSTELGSPRWGQIMLDYAAWFGSGVGLATLPNTARVLNLFLRKRYNTLLCDSLCHKFFSGREENVVRKHTHTLLLSLFPSVPLFLSPPTAPRLTITKTDQVWLQLEKYHCNHFQDDRRLECLLSKNNLK